MNWSSFFKRFLSLLMCLALLTGMLPVSVLAAEQETTADEIVSATTEASTEPGVIAVTGITLDVTTLEVGVGAEPVTLTATVAPTDATDKTVTWTSSEPGVASVVDGVVTFGYTGEAVITATAGEYSASCTVTVCEGEWSAYADDATDYLFIATDRHTNTSIIGSMIDYMEKNIGENELDYLGLGGDMVGQGNTHPTYTSSTVLAEITGATSSLTADNVDIVAGIHDMNVNDDADIVLSYNDATGKQIYEGARFYVYGVPESCISDDFSETVWSAQSQAFVDWANGSNIDKSKAIIVLSHYPLHVRRNDNDGASYWYDALNTVAAGDDATVDRNVVFFWGHNHTNESNADTAVYHVEPNGSITVEDGKGDTSTKHTIYFTYANAGYLNAKSSATLVKITDTAITFDKYVNSSVSTTYSVDRVAEATPTLSYIAITTPPATVNYTLGDTFSSEGLVVTATYSDGTTETVTGYILSDVDMTTAGIKTVTVTYEGQTATFDITVNEAVTEPTVNTVSCWDDTDQVIVEATGWGLTGITATNVNDGNKEKCDEVFTKDGYMAFDIALTGHTDGNEVTYSISVVSDLDTTNLELYYIDAEGKLIPVEFELTTDELNNVYVEFTTTYVGTFVYGSPVVPEGYALTTLTLEGIPTDLFVGGSLALNDAVITAVYTMDGAEDFVRTLTIYDYDETNFSNFDVNVAGAQTVKFIFEDVTATLDINVWGDSVVSKDDNVTVTLDSEGEEYGVTGVAVSESGNTNVATAIQYVITGDNYMAYDITLEYADGYSATEDTKTVTLPIPEVVTNPVVYYVPETGDAVNMNATVSEDGTTVSFTTTHFSTYVLGDGTTIETEEGTAPQPGTSATTTEQWVLTDTITAGQSYLIVDANSSSGHALINNNGTISYVDVTIQTDNDGQTYIELDNTAAEWTVGGSYTYVNNSKYLSWTTDYALTLADSAATWTKSGNTLSGPTWKTTSENGCGGTETIEHTGYLAYSSGWIISETSDDIYFYTKGDVTTGGSVATTYSTKGTDITDAIAISGQTVTLSSVLYSTPEGGTATNITASSGLTPTYEVVTTKGNPNVISSITDGVATLSGTAGTAVVKVTYTPGDLVAWDEFIVTAVAPTYEVAITAPESSTVKTGATTTLVATATVNGTTVDGANITWSSSDSAIATVDSATGEVTGISAGDVTITATYTDPAGSVHMDSVTLEVVDAVYVLDLVDGTTKESITAPVVIKGIEAGDTASVWAVITADGVDIGDVDDDAIEWTSSDTSIATVDPATGVITFTGKDGIVYITASYEYVTGKSVTDTVKFSVTASNYSIPSDGTSDFPEYPNEGAIRFDKTATAVGNFSETGIAQVELSMTGVPYTTDNAMDVVVMLDMTGSMSSNGMEAAEEATKAFVEMIVKNEDGTYNSNRVAVYAFNSGSSSPYELVSLKSITSDTELATANTAIDTASDKQTSGGTPFDEAAKKCYDVLQAAKTDGTGNDRQQFCVFMSDGGPTTYEGSDGYTYYAGNSSGDRKITSYISNYTSSTSSSWKYNLPTEYYTDLMKADGVTVYTVGLLLQSVPRNPSPYSSMTNSTYDSTTDTLTSIGSHYYFTSTILKNMASDESKYIDIFSVDTADNATAKFTAIASQILEAAKNVVVQDKIADDYTMVFAIPTGSNDIEGLDSQEFYIEVKEYTLDSNHERTSTYTSLAKIYLGVSNNTYYAASDANGTAYASPVFTAVSDGEKGYYSIVDSTYTATAGEIVLNVNGTYYKFIADGTGDYNMTSGAYAYGTIDSTTNTSTDLVIVTPYFCYSAATRMLAWTAEKLTTTELALSYFLYLDRSATEVGTDNEVSAGPYETNDWATITYTNFNGNECQQEFPVPQMTWSGAQVSYVFYLVNAAGQPINKSGQVVDFANATFVTDVFTKVVTWNTVTGEGAEELNVEYLADDLLPDAYTIYDENAKYTIHVYKNSDGTTIFDYFIIEGSEQEVLNKALASELESGEEASIETTKVYNTKSGNKYSVYGTYSAEEVGTEFETTDADGNTVTITTTKQASLDYSDTTVAFAVLWEPELVEDTVVVDFGLDVLINVVQNDYLQNTVSGIGLGKDAYVSANIEMNTGVSTTSKLGTAALTTSDGSTISIENENQIRFHQNDMTFESPVTFYYESPVEFYEGSNKQEGYMYSSVTVIPATTVYYEDSFLTLKSYTKDSSGTYNVDDTTTWVTVGSTSTATQDQDRPGESQISASLDADNAYGYDSAYTDMSTWSLGSAAKINVTSDKRGEATFTFYGTGFDVIGMTSNTTGTLIVQVYDVTGALKKTSVVDTYYSYTQDVKDEDEDGDTTEWIVSVNNPNALYQVPVMKISELTYGQYTVKITAGYNESFDHNTTDTGYDLYLDAIRIYDPTGVASGAVKDTTVSNAYVADGEGWPQYFELRNLIIDASGYITTTNNEDGTVTVTINDAATLAGAIFIDSNDATTSVADYVNYGPNNELYLAAGQSVAFKLDQTYASIIADVQIALKVGNGGSVTYKIYDSKTTNVSDATAKTLNTATDLYYSIKDLASGTIVITNAGESGILSITNIKVTYTENPYGTTTSSDEGEADDNGGIMLTSLYMDAEGATSALMSLRTVSASVPETEETEAETTESETEETEAETTESETEETEAETTESETEETETETTESETEETETETTETETEETEAEESETIVDIVKDIIRKISDIIGGWFGKRFH